MGAIAGVVIKRAAARARDEAELYLLIADDIQDAAERLGTNRHLDRAAGVDRLLATHQAVGRVHGDRANLGLAQMLGNLEHDEPAIEVLKWKEIYDSLEEAIDECEDVSNVLESIALKNS